jgi:hypothetical protein
VGMIKLSKTLSLSHIWHTSPINLSISYSPNPFSSFICSSLPGPQWSQLNCWLLASNIVYVFSLHSFCPLLSLLSHISFSALFYCEVSCLSCCSSCQRRALRMNFRSLWK